MDTSANDPNHRLNNAIDWTDTFAEELFNNPDSQLIDAIQNSDGLNTL